MSITPRKTAPMSDAMKEGEKLCPYCGGSGEEIAMTQQHGPDDYEFTVTCHLCHGTGIVQLDDLPGVPHD